MKRIIILVLALSMIASVASAAKCERRSGNVPRPVEETARAIYTIPPPPADAINLLHDEGYLTKEERDILLFADYTTLSDGDRSGLLTALRALGRRLANSPRLRRAVRDAFHALVYYTLEHCDGGQPGSYTPCPGSPYDPYMDQ